MTLNIQDQNNNNHNLRKIHLSDAVLVAAVPLLAYMIIFVFEWGYFGVLKIPMQFISFDINEIFIVIGSLILIGTAVLIWFNLLFQPYFLGKLPAPIINKLRYAIPIYCCLFAICIAYWDLYMESLPYWGGALIFTLDLFLPPLTTKRVKGKYLEKLEALDDLEHEEKKKNAANSLAARLIESCINLFGANFVFVTIYLLMLLFVIFHIGRAQALRQIDYRVVNTSPETVVLYIKPDKVIVAPFDRQTKEIEPVYRVLDYASNSNLEYRLENIGPLHLKEVISPIQTPTLTQISTPTIQALTITPTSTSTQTTIILSTPSPNYSP
jgi:hypothetical protein